MMAEYHDIKSICFSVHKKVPYFHYYGYLVPYHSTTSLWLSARLIIVKVIRDDYGYLIVGCWNDKRRWSRIFSEGILKI